jgi:hypothetical protein
MDRAVRMVFDAKDQYPSQWAAIESIAGKSRPTSARDLRCPAVFSSEPVPLRFGTRVRVAGCSASIPACRLNIVAQDWW